MLFKEILLKIINKGSGYIRIFIELEEEIIENLVNKLFKEFFIEKYMVLNIINEIKIILDVR